MPVNNTNLRRVAEVNQLSRRIEEEGLSPEHVRRELTRIEEHPGFPAALQIAVAGSPVPALTSCSAARRGIFVFHCCRKPVSGLCRLSRQSAFGTDRAHHSRQCLDHLPLHPLLPLRPGENFDAMIIGGIILMVPGVAFTNAIRDMADSDYISGSVRMLDAVISFFLHCHRCRRCACAVRKYSRCSTAAII